MKLTQSILVTTALAVYYRGGTYKVIQRRDGQLTIENTQSWIRWNWPFQDKYADKCQTTTQSYIPMVADYCVSGDCSYTLLYYTASLVGNNYCYGDGSNVIQKPSGPFEMKWHNCCWADVTYDDGTMRISTWFAQVPEYMALNMIVKDVNNNSPSFKLPPLWLVMAGCPNQQIDLAPVDADGDTIKCRRATFEESGGAYNQPGKWPSLSANCTVKYDGTLDATIYGAKPVALMMEDFDANGNVRSSIPVQFLAQVWTPNPNTRSIGAANYPEWFSSDASEHEEHVKHEKRPNRGRRSLPAYCTAVPTFVAPTLADGQPIDGSSGSVSFTLAAQSPNGSITGFSYQGPSGLTCTKVNSKSQITCNWILSAAQRKIESHSFCYDATDNLGYVTYRQCLAITTALKIRNIGDMAVAVLDGSGANKFTAADGEKYGCAGRGMYDAFATTAGAQVDAIDKSFYTWKKCVQCAHHPKKHWEQLSPYNYDKNDDSCADSSDESRGVCECDRALVNYLFDKKAENSNYSADQCVPGGIANTACCKWNNFMFAQYNVDHQSCCLDGVKEAGSC